MSETYGLPLDPARLVGDLSAGERQRVEIIRCLLQDPKLLIMDEPTSVLTPQEVEILFKTLRKLQSEGTSILYISHKLEEIRSLCDGATILRLGKVVGSCDPREKSARELAEMMVGTELKTPAVRDHALGEVALGGRWSDRVRPLRLSGRSCAMSRCRCARARFWGSAVSRAMGRTNCWRCLSGEMQVAPEKVRLKGAPIGALGPNARRAIGILAAPEERLGHAAAPDMSTGRERRPFRLGPDEDGQPGLRELGQGAILRRRGDRGLRRAHAGVGQCGAVAVGRELAEIRDRARDHAKARGSGGEPADLGRRCQCRGGDPAGACWIWPGRVRR